MIVITLKHVCHDNKIDVRVVSFSKIKTFLRTVDVFSYVARKTKKYSTKNDQILRNLMSAAEFSITLKIVFSFKMFSCSDTRNRNKV